MSTKGFSLQNNSPTNHKDRLHRHPRNDILGIDFWHAVEFSKFGRTSPPHTTRAGHQDRPAKLPACILGVKSAIRSPSGRTRAHLAFGGRSRVAGLHRHHDTPASGSARWSASTRSPLTWPTSCAGWSAGWWFKRVVQARRNGQRYSSHSTSVPSSIAPTTSLSQW